MLLAETSEARRIALQRPATRMGRIDLFGESPRGHEVGLIGLSLELGCRLARQPAQPVLGKDRLEGELGDPLERQPPVHRQGVEREAVGLVPAEAREDHAAALRLDGDLVPGAPARAFGEEPPGEQRLSGDRLAARAAHEKEPYGDDRRALGAAQTGFHSSSGRERPSTDPACGSR